MLKKATDSGPGAVLHRGVDGVDPVAGLERRVLDQLLRRIQHGVVTVVYWDGQRRTYGDVEPQAPTPAVTIRIADPSVIRRAALSASVAFGEAYARARSKSPKTNSQHCSGSYATTGTCSG